MNESIPAVVVGLDCVTGLQTARILARRGIPVIGVAADPGHWACRTRSVRRVVHAADGPKGLVAALTALGPSLPDRGVLYPCSDEAVMAISRAREDLREWYHIALPDHAVVTGLMDKVTFAKTAEDLGLRIPRTRVVRTPQEIEESATELRFPCIVKPSLRTERWMRSGGAKVYRVSTPEDLRSLYTRCGAWTDELVVQEWIPGDDSCLFSCNLYLDRRGESLVSFVARKLRQWPPETGVSCLGEECRNDEVREMAIRLFKGTGFHGLAYLEVKRDTRTGEHYAIEANVGRPTGRSAIAEAGGVEILQTMHRDQLGMPLPAERVQQYGSVKWIFLRQDVRSAFHYWRRGELTLTDWARSWGGRKSYAVWSWRDPRPFFTDLARTAAALFSGSGRKFGRAPIPRALAETEHRPHAPA
jgi:D-aspartate ligase